MAISKVLVQSAFDVPLTTVGVHDNANREKFREMQLVDELSPSRDALACSKGSGRLENPGSCVGSMWEHRNVFINSRKTRGLKRGE